MLIRRRYFSINASLPLKGHLSAYNLDMPKYSRRMFYNMDKWNYYIIILGVGLVTLISGQAVSALDVPPQNPRVTNGYPVATEAHSTSTARPTCAQGGAGPPVGAENVVICQQSTSEAQRNFAESANTPLNTAPSNGPTQTTPPAGTPPG